MRLRRVTTLICLVMTLSVLPACLPSPPTGGADVPSITLYGFSIMKEPLERDIFPGFKKKWKAEHGQDVEFVTSFAGSETVTNQILQGAPANVAILAIDRDAQRLADAGATTTDWHQYPAKGIINKTPFVILVRKGNPKGIHDFPDLAKPGVQVIHPDPASSGGAQWSILAIYGSEIAKSKAETGTADTVRATAMLKSIWANVFSTPGSAREARTHFEAGFGDALVTYELDALQMTAAGAPVEIVVPKASIFSEHPIVPIDRNNDAEKAALVDAFIRYMWSDEAQKGFVANNFRSVTNDSFDDDNPALAKIEMPFTIDMFGGWPRAYPDIIDGVFRAQVQGKR